MLSEQSMTKLPFKVQVAKVDIQERIVSTKDVTFKHRFMKGFSLELNAVVQLLTNSSFCCGGLSIRISNGRTGVEYASS